MNTQNQKQQEQKKSSFEEGLMDNNNQQQTPKMSEDPSNKNPGDKSDPEIDIPFTSPEKTEKKIPDMKGGKS